MVILATGKLHSHAEDTLRQVNDFVSGFYCVEFNAWEMRLGEQAAEKASLLVMSHVCHNH